MSEYVWQGPLRWGRGYVVNCPRCPADAGAAAAGPWRLQARTERWTAGRDAVAVCPAGHPVAHPLVYPKLIDWLAASADTLDGWPVVGSESGWVPHLHRVEMPEYVSGDEPSAHHIWTPWGVGAKPGPSGVVPGPDRAWWERQWPGLVQAAPELPAGW